MKLDGKFLWRRRRDDVVLVLCIGQIAHLFVIVFTHLSSRSYRFLCPNEFAKKKCVDADLGHIATRATSDAIHVLACNGERGQNSEANRANLTLILARKDHKHLSKRPIEEEHNMVALGSARPLRTPTKLIEKDPDSRSLEELKVVESSSRLIFN